VHFVYFVFFCLYVFYFIFIFIHFVDITVDVCDNAFVCAIHCCVLCVVFSVIAISDLPFVCFSLAVACMLQKMVCVSLYIVFILF